MVLFRVVSDEVGFRIVFFERGLLLLGLIRQLDWKRGHYVPRNLLNFDIRSQRRATFRAAARLLWETRRTLLVLLGPKRCRVNHAPDTRSFNLLDPFRRNVRRESYAFQNFARVRYFDNL